MRLQISVRRFDYVLSYSLNSEEYFRSTLTEYPSLKAILLEILT